MALKKGIFAGILALACSCFNEGSARQNVSDAGNIAGIEDKVEKYALLISGRTESRHVLNMSLVYNFLLEQGFERKNMQVLDENGQERYYLYPVNDMASRETIEDALRELKQKVDSNDLLFVYVSDHGRREKAGAKEVSTIGLPDSELNQLEFSQYLEGISPALGLFVFEQCYSGGFGKAVGSGNIIAFASTTADAIAYTPAEYDSAGAQFILGFRNKDESDADNDGRVSLQEAFDYMLANHTRTKEGRQFPAIYSDLGLDDVYFFE